MMFHKTASLLHLSTARQALHYYCTHICLTAIKKEPNPTNLNPSSLGNGNNDRSHSGRVFVRYNENGTGRIVQCAPVRTILLDVIKKNNIRRSGHNWYCSDETVRLRTDTSELECVPRDVHGGSIRIATILRLDNP